ncbi:MAG: superoxide dismutase [Ignavibacteria bacterium]|nr:superoxide dismutase [Ignavibacteria bacterium]
MSSTSRRKFLKTSALGAVSLGVLSKFEYLNNKYIPGLTPGEPKGGFNTMAYEWKFNPRPYSDEEAKTLLKDVIDAETTDWHYNTHHKGYVTFLNNIEKELESADLSKANGNWSDIGELKRRFTWNHSGAYLHDVYWDNMGGDGDISKGPDVKKAIEENFGSFDNWKAEFKACSVAAKLSGWGLLVFDRLYSGRLINVLVDEHQYGAIWGGVPLVACDVFEHAYYHKDGPGRAKYIDNFINGLNWARINDRFNKYCK